MKRAQRYRLTPKEEAFAQALVRGMGPVKAYEAAGYSMDIKHDSAIRTKAHNLKRRANIMARVEELQGEISRETVLEQADMVREIHALATSDIRGIINEKGQVRMPHELDRATAAAVAKFKMSFDGTIEYTFHSKTTALDQACKILGLYEKDNKQKTDPLADLLRSLGGTVQGVTADNSSRDPGDDDA